jgi:hypothetical protein
MESTLAAGKTPERYARTDTYTAPLSLPAEGLPSGRITGLRLRRNSDVQWSDGAVQTLAVLLGSALSGLGGIALNNRFQRWKAGKDSSATAEVRHIDHTEYLLDHHIGRITVLEKRVEENQRAIQALNEAILEERRLNNELLRKIDVLTADNKHLLDDNTSLKNDNCTLRENCQEMQARIRDLMQQNVARSEEVTELIDRLDGADGREGKPK